MSNHAPYLLTRYYLIVLSRMSDSVCVSSLVGSLCGYLCTTQDFRVCAFSCLKCPETKSKRNEWIDEKIISRWKKCFHCLGLYIYRYIWTAKETRGHCICQVLKTVHLNMFIFIANNFNWYLKVLQVQIKKCLKRGCDMTIHYILFQYLQLCQEKGAYCFATATWSVD